MKYFFIGFNKCATTAIERVFQVNSMKFQHRLDWKIENYDGFSDTGVLPFQKIIVNKKTVVSHYKDGCDKHITWDRHNYDNFKKLYNMYPSSFFILNTRQLKGWIYSRFKHGYFGKRDWAHPISKELIDVWIHNRDLYYTDILSHFQANKKNFLIVDIDSDNWQKRMCDILGIKHLKNQVENVTNSNKNITSKSNKNITSKIDSTFSKLKLPEYTLNTNLLTNEKKSDFYKNIYKSNLIE
jgi:hypothetical protein